MNELKASLNYYFNFNQLLSKQLICNLKKKDQRCAIDWIYFLMNSEQILAEMQLRNDFMHYLILNLQEGFLRPPFDSSPPKSNKLAEIANLIPGRYDDVNIEDDSENSESEPFESDRPTVMSKSPDGGAFLSQQPVPHEGSFCYLAITTKKQN